MSGNRAMLDLAIIGGGPAGTAAALEARRRGLRVAVWERDRFPRHKVCGEFISAEALPWLWQEIPQSLARGAAIHRAEFISAKGFQWGFSLPHSARGLSRHLLDAALWESAAEAGVEEHPGEGIRSVRKLSGPGDENVWELESLGGVGQTAKTLIVACGRWWHLEGFPSPARQAKPGGEWIGAKAHFAGLKPRASVEMYLFPGGYCGLAPIEDGKCNVCCLVNQHRIRDVGSSGMDNLSAWLARVSCHPALQARLRGAAQVSPVVTTAPVRLERRSATKDGALLVGDASGFLDPFTGEGISMALHSGRLAGNAIAESLAGGMCGMSAAELYKRNMGEAVRRSYRVAALARTLIHAPVWLQSLSVIPLPWLGTWLLKETRWRAPFQNEAS